MNDIAPGVTQFYADVMQLMQKKSLPFLVGGAFAFQEYTGIFRYTKDFDFFVQPADVDEMLKVCRNAGYKAEYVYPHWIAKIHHEDAFIDVIFRGGNGLCEVNSSWFENARRCSSLGITVDLCPPEELIYIKSFVMDRLRFDGTDVAHLFHACGHTLDWERLAALYGEYWHILLCHLILFMFIYPGETSVIPELLFRDLLDKARAQRREPPADERLCRGTLLARSDFQMDIEEGGFRDPRQVGPNALNASDIERWTNAVD